MEQDAAPPVLPDASFTVHYQTFGGRAINPELKGTGTFTARSGGTAFTFSGRKRALFSGKPAEVNLTDGQICNVQLEGRMIHFTIEPGTPGAPSRAFVFFCDNPADAEKIRALLPTRVDADFAASLTFNDRLRAMSAGQSPFASVTNILIAVNVIVFVVMAGLLDAGWFDVTSLGPYIRYGANNGAATTDGEWWRLVSSMFMHFGVLHLALNMWALFQVGQLLERLQGRALFTATYFASGIGGSVLSLLWHGDKLWSAGASGAIFGAYGAVLGYFLREKQSLPRAIVQPMLKSTLTFAGYNLFYGLVHPGIDNLAHIGGLLSGFAVGWLTAMPLDPAVRAQRTASRLGVAGAVIVALFAAAYAAAPRYNYSIADELAFSAALKGVGEQENALVKKQNETLARWDQKADNPEACTTLIEGELIPFYRALGQKLDALSLAPGKITARRRDLLNTFVHLRLEGYPHLLRGIRERNDDEIKAYRAIDEKAAAAIKAIAELK